MSEEQGTNKFLKFLFSLIIAILLIFVIALGVSFIYRLRTTPIEATPGVAKSNPDTARSIQLNILNACDVKGIANKTKNYLRARGFDVVAVGNNKTEESQTSILDRVGDRISAHKLAIALGVGDSIISERIDSSLFVRLTLVLGKDYYKLKPFK